MEVNYLINGCAVLLMLQVAWGDMKTRRIPNWISLAFVGLALVRIGLDMAGAGSGNPVSLSPIFDLSVAAAVMAFTAFLFAFGAIGGGDAKLLASATFFLGASQALSFLFATALAGAVLALVFLMARMLRKDSKGLNDRTDSLPYGVAIAAGCSLVVTGVI